MAKKGDPAAHKDAKTDPLFTGEGAEWPQDSREVFWKQAQEFTGAEWNFTA